MEEYSELKICDHYLSWGWIDEHYNVIPVGALKEVVKKKSKNNRETSILLLISSIPRYSDGILAMPISGQWINYFNDQMELYGKLPDHIANNITVRLYPHDYGWSQLDRWKEKFPNSKIDDCEKKFKDVILNTDLFISGWNSTTYLEAMLSNVPTIIFWEPSYFEIKSDAKQLFKN